MTSIELVPFDEGYLLPVNRKQVTRCCIDFSRVTILLINLIEIAIEKPFILETPEGQVYTLDPSPSSDPTSLTPILRIMRQVLEEGTAFNNGRLELTFGEGIKIKVPPGERYEAWTLSGPHGLKIVSIPGGDLAIWSPQAEPG